MNEFRPLTSFNASDALRGFGAPSSLGGINRGLTDPLIPGGSRAVLERNENNLTFGQRLFGKVDPTTGKQVTQGFALPALGAVSSIGNGLLGLKQFGLAKKSFNFQKDAFNRSFEAQKNITNSDLVDRARARQAASPNGNTLSEAETLSRFGVK